MKLLTAVAAASLVVVGGAVAAAAGAASSKGTTHVHVKAPAIGKGLIEAVSFNVTVPKGAKPSFVRARVTNAKALGPGFYGIAIVEASKKPSPSGVKKETLYLVMFTGNLSSSTAGTVNLDVSPPAGAPPGEKVTTTRYVTSNFHQWCGDMSDWNGLFEDGNTVSPSFDGAQGIESESIQRILPEGKEDSPPEAFLDNMISALAPANKCGFTPETPEPGDK